MLTSQRTPIGFVITAQTPDVAISFNVSKLSDREGYLTGFLQITAYGAGKKYNLHSGRFNFASTRTRKDLSSYIEKLNVPLDIQWDQLIEAMCQKIIEEYYKPEEPIRITPIEYTAPEFLLYPLLIKGYPVLIYAPGGSGKSFVAMLVALLVKNGKSLNFTDDGTKEEVLYLDWEMDITEARRRFSMLVPSFETEMEFPLYKQCVLPFQDELENILRIATENDVGLIIIDSVAPALGGDINDNSKVIEFFGAVRKFTSLGITVLMLSHVSKAHKEKEDGAMPIGAVFFENLSRLTWELKYSITENTNVMDIALILRKSNFGKLPTVGFNVLFEDGCAFFKKLSNPEQIATTKKQTQEEVILSILAEEKSTVANISKLAGIDKDRVYQILSELKRQGKVTNADRGTWELVH